MQTFYLAPGEDCGGDWVCIGGNIAHELTEEPLWVPSFIDERIWAQAVSKFCIDSRLDENVVEFLLPEMDEYLQNIPDSELISITKRFPNRERHTRSAYSAAQGEHILFRQE